jgi:hypothetical protein
MAIVSHSGQIYIDKPNGVFNQENGAHHQDLTANWGWFESAPFLASY